MLLQVLAGLACLFAALLHFAVHRSPDVADSKHIKHARMITLVAMLIAAISIFDSCIAGKVWPVLDLVAGLFALGQILYALPHLQKGDPWKSLWNSLP